MTDDEGDDRPGRSGIPTDHGGHGPHLGMRRKDSFDLPKFNAVATDLHLMVGAAEKFQLAVHPPATAIAGAIEPCGRIVGEWIGDEPLRREFRSSPVAPCDGCPADPKVAGHAPWHRLSMTVKQIDLCVGDRPPNRREIGPGGRVGWQEIPGRDVRFGGPVVIPKPARRQMLEELSDCRSDPQLFTGDDHLPERLRKELTRLRSLRQMVKHHDRQKQPVDAVAINRCQQGRRIPSRMFRDEHERAPGQPGREDLLKRNIEARTRELQRAVARAHAGGCSLPRQQIDERAVRHGHPFGLAGRARCVEHVGQLVDREGPTRQFAIGV